MPTRTVPTSCLTTEAKLKTGKPVGAVSRLVSKGSIRTWAKQRSQAISFAAIVLLLVTGAAKAGWAQQPCPPSPNYSPDFSSNQNCLVPNGNATFATGGSTALQITSSAGGQTGSAWYLTPQVVQNGFSTTFQFQFTNASNPPADGIAFLIQNSGTAAMGVTGYGGALGYGDADSNPNPSQGQGIPHSVAIEFDTFQNGWDPGAVNNSVSHVAIQSCGTGPNTSHHGYLCNGDSGPNSTVGSPVATANLADGAVHTVTITYVPACSSCSPATPANIQVVLDGTNLYANGVAVDLSSIGLNDGGTALVGFTGATGSDFETQDILTWTFTPTQQGTPINPNDPGTLTQSFVADNTPGQHEEFDFDYSVANNNGLSIQPGTTPFVTPGGITPLDWASIVNGTALADAPCLTAAGQSVCAVSTLTCTTTGDPTASGANCPQSTVRNVLFNQEIDLNLNQPGIVDGILTVPSGYAPGLAMAPDVLVSGSQCSYPSGNPLSSQLCPQNIMTQLEDATVRSGGTGTTTNSSYVLICCEPEWQTTPNIPLWTNSTSVPVSFTSQPPKPPNPNNNNNFQAAQGASIVFGAEPRGVNLDTTFPLPAEQTLNNPIPCPALGQAPTPWSTQNPQPFSVNGTMTSFDNNGTVSPLVEGAYDAHFFSVDCDSFEELVYPAQIDVHPGTPGPNVATFKTVPFNVDTTSPVVTSITLSPGGGYYPQNSALTATVSCNDPSSQTVPGFFSGIAQCGPQSFGGNQQSVTTTPIYLSTSSIGPQTFTATAVDAAGNTSSSVSVNYQVVGAADVAAGMIGNVFVKSGTKMTYYISVINLGPNIADAVSLTDILPAGTTFVSSGYARESCNFNGVPSCSISSPTNSCGNVAGTCNVGNVARWTLRNPVGILVQITVNVTAKANTSITNTATVSEANYDATLNDNTTKWTTFVTK